MKKGYEVPYHQDDGRRRPTPEEDIRQLIEELNTNTYLLEQLMLATIF